MSPNPNELPIESMGASAPMQEMPPMMEPGMEPLQDEQAQASPQPPPPDSGVHLQLSPDELQKIATQIEADFSSAEGDHEQRMNRWTGYYRRWRNLADPQTAGQEHGSNFDVPMTQWTMWQVWAQIMSALLGDDAEVVATPTGPSDQRSTPRVGKFMTWRLFSSMKIATSLTIHMFRVALFGRAFAYAPYVRQTYRTKESGQVTDKVSYEGPGFEPLWPSDLIVPAEDVRNVQEFSFVVRRYWVTPQQLLQGERDGKYFGITERWLEIINSAANQSQRSAAQSDELKESKDEAEGVVFGASYTGRAFLQVWEWYGKRRLPKDRSTSPDENSVDQREMDETQIVVRYLPTVNGVSSVIGIQDLMECYPHMPNRVPIVETALVLDGSYWCPGVGEMVERLEDSSTTWHRLFEETGQFAMGPVIFTRPGTGLKQKLQHYEPRMIVEVEDPAGVKPFQPTANLADYQVAMQSISAMTERVVGRTDLSGGRSIDRPNAPKTATGTVALLEAGNIRVSLDMMVIREHMRLILEHFWRLDTYFSPRQLFFRVTEEDAGGLWDDVRNGFATLTDEERQGNYDFDLKFATSVWSKEAKKQEQIALYQIDLQNPLIAMNPQALYSITKRVHAAFGDDQFGEIVPAPPMEDRARTPKEEWTLALQGDEFNVHPADVDDAHIADHTRRIVEQRGMPNRDEDAINRMIRHIVEHESQKTAKQAMMAGAAQFAEALSGAGDQYMAEGLQQALAGQQGQGGKPAAKAQPA